MTAIPAGSNPGVVALIPARSGSKGVVSKNLQLVNGVSLLERAVRCASAVPTIDKIIVSSDCDKALQLGSSLGALKHKRSLEASSDTSTANDVVKEVVSDFALPEDTVLVYLQPTNPFRASETVRRAVSAHLEHRSPVVGVTPLKQLPSKALKIDSDGMTAAYSEGNSLSGNRQDAQAGCYPNGALYVFSVIQFRGQGIPVAKARPLIMSISESLDIDELADLEFANSIAPCVEKLLK